MAVAPERVYWHERASRLEVIWLVLAVVMVVVFFSSMMLIWHAVGRQNVVGQAYRVDPRAYKAQVEAFAQQYRVGEEAGRPVVEPPPGSDVYIYATRFAFYPILRLQAGQRYTLHIASLDYLHGFSITNPHQWNLQLYPGYEWVLPFTPTRPGVYNLACNEYCGLGHEFMLGKIVVVER
jgi:cytochrome c oxidase subunit 2